MRFTSPLIGIAAACFLLAVLALARLLVVRVEVPDLTIREIEVTTIEEPPPPPPVEPPPDAPPPPPALTDVADIPDPALVPVPKAEAPMDITLPVETFFSDVPPAPLPEVPAESPRPRPQPAKPAPTTRPAPPRPPAPVAKSHYQVNELDGTPRLLRHGSAQFPPALARRGVARGTVVLEVELSTGGSVSVRRVISSSHPELVAPARRVAGSSRFTPPTRRGQPVKAIMRWPITIQK